MAERVAVLMGAGPVEVVWSSRFRIHRRASPRFRVGRVLLAGDAAHVHSPIGGQGMNLGIQDAGNLAWKLARALHGGDLEPLLDSYDVERRAVAVEDVSRFTDLMTRLFLQAPILARGAAFALFRALLMIPPARRRLLRRLTMIDLDYPASPLLDRDERAAGVRLPNALLQAPDGGRARLYTLLPGRPALLDLAGDRWSGAPPPVPDVIRIGPGAYHDSSGSLRRLLGHKDGWILVRPDARVAWARDHLEGVEAATSRALGDTIPARSVAGLPS